MQFDFRMSQDTFQRKIDQTYENCQEAVGIAHDVQVFDHDPKKIQAIM